MQSADLCQRIRSRVRIQKFIVDFLVQRYSVIKYSWKSDQFFQRYEPNCAKMLYLSVEESLDNFL